MPYIGLELLTSTLQAGLVSATHTFEPRLAQEIAPRVGPAAGGIVAVASGTLILTLTLTLTLTLILTLTLTTLAPCVLILPTDYTY